MLNKNQQFKTINNLKVIRYFPFNSPHQPHSYWHRAPIKQHKFRVHHFQLPYVVVFVYSDNLIEKKGN